MNVESRLSAKNNSPIEDIRFTTLIVASKFLPEIIGAL
jgi:hypothetical protein